MGDFGVVLIRAYDTRISGRTLTVAQARVRYGARPVRGAGHAGRRLQQELDPAWKGPARGSDICAEPGLSVVPS